MKKNPKSTADYLKSAREIKAFAPSLAKYSRRKSLRPQEKAAIQRKLNLVSKLSRSAELKPLTKQQFKSLRDKSVTVGQGIRAVRLRNQPDAKISVERGRLIVRSHKRKFEYFKTRSDADSIIDKARDLFAKRKRRQAVYLLNQYGRSAQGFGDLNSLTRFLDERWSQYKATQEWFKGLVLADL